MKRMAKKDTHKEVMDFIRVIRESFLDAALVYRYGGCYGFYKILKHRFPSAIAYYDDNHKDHILSKINGRFYDITGEVDCVVCKQHYWENPIKLTEIDHEHWGPVAMMQRIEFMVAKHDSNAKKKAKQD